jgi:hypothetical protein
MLLWRPFPEVDAVSPEEPDTRARAVSGVGGPMTFLGVSGPDAAPEDGAVTLRDEVDEPRRLLVEEVARILIGFARPPVKNGCFMAVWGFSRRSGSQIKHLVMKSMNSASSHRRTWASVLLPARRLRPLELTTGRGAPVASATHHQ